MEHEEKSLPRAARYARNVALAAWPFGLMAGIILSSGQDAAGAGLGFALGIALGAVVSAFFGICYWVLKSANRTRLLLRFGWIPALVVAIWLAVHFLSPQQYWLSVVNASGDDLSDVEVQIAGLKVSIGELKKGAVADTKGLEVPPESALTIDWVDAMGSQQSVSVDSREPPYYRHDGGTLKVYMYPENVVIVHFAWDSRPLF